MEKLNSDNMKKNHRWMYEEGEENAGRQADLSPLPPRPVLVSGD